MPVAFLSVDIRVQSPDKCWVVLVSLEEEPPPYNHADSRASNHPLM